MVGNKLSIESMVNIRDHKLFHKEDMPASNLMVLHKVIIKIQLPGTVEAEKQDAQTSL